VTLGPRRRAPHAPRAVHTGSPGETRALAAALATVARPGDVVLLVGDLGAGKTTFAQGFAAGLGVTGPVTSPTFTLVRSYPVPPGSRADTGAGIRTLLHADMYRLDHRRDIAELGLGEQVEDEAVLLVEWGDVAAPVLGGDSLTVELHDRGDGIEGTDGGPDEGGERRVALRWQGVSWEARADAVDAVLALVGAGPERS
jgi:tRNA threonylcarbamoyladenosine biosynthesis protein TsaE